jgi:hypothetical protein
MALDGAASIYTPHEIPNIFGNRPRPTPHFCRWRRHNRTARQRPNIGKIRQQRRVLNHNERRDNLPGGPWPDRA